MLLTKKRTPRGFRNRLPGNGFVPNPDYDYPIFLHLADHRLLRTSHLMALTGRSRSALNNRLRHLKNHGYIGWVNPKKEAHYKVNAEDLHALGDKGADIVASLRHVHRQTVSYTDLNREIGRDHVSHTLLVSDFLVALIVACENSGGAVRFISTTEILTAALPNRKNSNDPLLLRAKVVSKGVRREDATRPDAMFGLHFLNDPEGKNKAYFFLEADRGTMRQKKGRNEDWRSIYKKYEVYYGFNRAKSVEPEFGIKNFRVLFLTDRTEERARNSIAAVEPIHPGGWNQWMFSWKGHVLGAPDVLSVPWITGKGESATLKD